MMQQVSVFAENIKGSMGHMTTLLREAGVNIMELVTNDSAEFGIVRMIVTDTDAAVKALKDGGYLVRTDKIIGVYLEDECGSLDNLLKKVTDSNINIDYLYITYDRLNPAPIAVMKCESAAEVEEILRGKGFRVISGNPGAPQ